jgi:hypothetical protein
MNSNALMTQKSMKTPIAGACLVAAAVAALPTPSLADERMFTYSYEAVSVLPKGGWEFEQWITYRGDKGEGTFARWDLREELEYGVTDRYTTALYLNFRDTHRDLGGGSEVVDDFEFKGVSSEHKYQLINPHTKPIGVLLYGEITTDGAELELEQKLILQKFFGEDERWNAVFNAVVEEEWEFESSGTEESMSIEFTTGLSYKLNSHWAVGLEGRNHRVFDGFSTEEEASAWFLGPNLHYGSPKWWATLTVLPQITGRPDSEDGLNFSEHERIEVRLIAGINF